VIYPVRVNPDGTRRRSSVWSSITVSPGTSPDGKRAAIMNLFRKGNPQSEAPIGVSDRETEESAISFNDVNMGGKKKVEVE